MFIIIEKEELIEMYEHLETMYATDIPSEAAPKKLIFENITELLNIWLTQEIDISTDIDLLMYDEVLVDLAQKVITHIKEHIVSLNSCSWVRLLDQHGGLVIHIQKRGSDT